MPGTDFDESLRCRASHFDRSCDVRDLASDKVKQQLNIVEELLRPYALNGMLLRACFVSPQGCRQFHLSSDVNVLVEFKAGSEWLQATVISQAEQKASVSPTLEIFNPDDLVSWVRDRSGSLQADQLLQAYVEGDLLLFPTLECGCSVNHEVPDRPAQGM